MLFNNVMNLDNRKYKPSVYFSVESPGVKLFYESKGLNCIGKSVYYELQSVSIETVCTPLVTENQTGRTKD